MAEGDEADIVLLYACCGIQCQKVKGAGAGCIRGSTKQEVGGKRSNASMGVNSKRKKEIVLLLFSAAITCSLSTYELSVLMLRPLNFFLSYFW